MTTGAEGITGSSSQEPTSQTTSEEQTLPNFPKAPESTRNMMITYFGIENPTPEDLKKIDGLIYQMQMGAYNYLKNIFKKSREKRKEFFREEMRSQKS